MTVKLDSQLREKPGNYCQVFPLSLYFQHVLFHEHCERGRFKPQITLYRKSELASDFLQFGEAEVAELRTETYCQSEEDVFPIELAGVPGP
jgi:hypothetical protein